MEILFVRAFVKNYWITNSNAPQLNSCHAKLVQNYWITNSTALQLNSWLAKLAQNSWRFFLQLNSWRRRGLRNKILRAELSMSPYRRCGQTVILIGRNERTRSIPWIVAGVPGKQRINPPHACNVLSHHSRSEMTAAAKALATLVHAPKRHRKQLKDCIQGISSASIRRMARRGGVKRISGVVYEEARGALKNFVQNVLRGCITLTEHARRNTVTMMDVVCTHWKDKAELCTAMAIEESKCLDELFSWRCFYLEVFFFYENGALFESFLLVLLFCVS